MGRRWPVNCGNLHTPKVFSSLVYSSYLCSTTCHVIPSLPNYRHYPTAKSTLKSRHQEIRILWNLKLKHKETIMNHPKVHTSHWTSSPGHRWLITYGKAMRSRWRKWTVPPLQVWQHGYSRVQLEFGLNKLWSYLMLIHVHCRSDSKCHFHFCFTFFKMINMLLASFFERFSMFTGLQNESQKLEFHPINGPVS